MREGQLKVDEQSREKSAFLMCCASLQGTAKWLSPAGYRKAASDSCTVPWDFYLYFSPPLARKQGELQQL